MTRPVPCVQHLIAADLDHLAVQHEDAAGVVAGVPPEVGDGVVADDQVLDIREGDGAVAEGAIVRLGDVAAQRGQNRVGGDRQVLDADDLLVFAQIEESDRADPAEPGIADAVAANLDVAQPARGDDPSATLATGRRRGWSR